LQEIREGFELLLAPRAQPQADVMTLGGVPALAVGRECAATGRLILFIHGGGFQIGSPRSHLGLMSRIAAASEARVIGIGYRLAPEHRFPAALDDCKSAYAALVAQGLTPRRVAVAGDSAGGHLALGLCIDAARRGCPPAGLVLISPWLDMSLSGASYVSRQGLDVFSKPAQLRAMARSYLGRDGRLDDPRIALLDSDLGGLPPLLIHAGDHDITLDDAVRLNGKAAAAGVSCRLETWSQMMHHFQVFEELPEAEESVSRIGAFVRTILP
jgi:acetyl esterase/lipase